MQTTTEKVTKFIANSESATIEWKQSLSENKEIIETAVAFSNAQGGRIYVGVSPQGKVTGTHMGKGTIGKLEKQEKWEYPPKAIREALANAIAHRDYRSTAKAQVRIFDDRIEFWNPGRLPEGWTAETLLKKHDSQPPNPLIAKQFFWIKYVEEVGSGTNKIVNWCREWGLPDPLFEYTGTSIIVTLKKAHITPGKVKEGAVEKTGEKTREKSREKNSDRLLALIRQKSTITTDELVTSLELSCAGVEKIISNLKKAGRLRRIGPDKGGQWEVVR